MIFYYTFSWLLFVNCINSTGDCKSLVVACRQALLWISTSEFYVWFASNELLAFLLSDLSIYLKSAWSKIKCSLKV